MTQIVGAYLTLRIVWHVFHRDRSLRRLVRAHRHWLQVRERVYALDVPGWDTQWVSRDEAIV